MEKQIVINEHILTEYTVSDKGEIFSNKFERKIQLRHNRVTGGYHIVRIYVNGKKFDELVARLVATAFIPNTFKKPQVNHIDGNKDNNNVKNLEWVTQSENIKHAYDIKLMTKTHKDCYNASLTEHGVIDIRTRIADGEKQRDIASLHGVSESVISAIKHGRSYKGVGLIPAGLAIDINTL